MYFQRTEEKKDEITWVNAMNLSLYSTLVSMLLALVIYAGSSQVIFDLQDKYLWIAETNDLISIYIFLAGFFIVSLIQGIAVILSESTRANPQVTITALILSFLINTVMWFAISYFAIYLQFPEVFEGLVFWQKFAISPRVLAYFTVITMRLPIVFWEVAILTHGIIFMLTIKLLSNYKYKKDEPTYRGMFN